MAFRWDVGPSHWRSGMVSLRVRGSFGQMHNRHPNTALASDRREVHRNHHPLLARVADRQRAM